MSSEKPLNKVKLRMNLEELYQWLKQLKGIFDFLGYWQVFGLALYSYGVVLARQCAPSKVAEELALIGQAATVQRRLERWLANERIDWLACCVAWSGFVLRHSVAVVGLPTRGVADGTGSLDRAPVVQFGAGRARWGQAAHPSRPGYRHLTRFGAGD